MKKVLTFLALSLLLTCFFACEFNQPKAIEIKGTPSLKFAETVDIGEKFTSLLDDAIKSDDKMTVFPCNKTTNFTYLIHMNLFETDFKAIDNADKIGDLQEYFPDINLSSSDLGTALSKDESLIDNDNDRLELPLSELGSLLNKFEFSGYKTLLYFSGTSLISKAKVDIGIYEGNEKKGGEKGIPVKNAGSNIDDWNVNGYNSETYPTDGVVIEFPLTGNDIAVSFKVYIPEGTTLKLEDFAAGHIKVEVVVWLPLEFTAGSNGAEIAFPKDAFFSSDKDLFNRESAGEDNIITDIVESMSMSIKFDKPIFDGADLIVESNGGNKSLEINNPVKNNTLSFSLSEEDMKKINDPAYFPFAPNLKIKFSAGKTLSFPREFNATEFNVQAKIRYKIDL